VEAFTSERPIAPGEAPAQLMLDPVSRVPGLLAFHATVDADSASVREGWAMARLFRGYEPLLQGRDARDAIYIASRACGACGGAHATCAAMATEMAFGIQPPPMAIAARNLLSALEHCYELPLQLFTREGPDYSQAALAESRPELWRAAAEAPAPRHATHGFGRIGEIVAALKPGDGELYIEGLRMARVAGEAYVLLGGKYPHPQTLVPGGVSATVDTQDLNLALMRIVKLLDYAHWVAALWDDLVEFLYEAEPAFRELGASPASFIDLGQWDDPRAYDATFENCAEWGERRWATPGVVVDGHLQTTSLTEIDRGVEEHVGHSFYAEWSAGRGPAERSAVSRVSRNHPSVKRTLPEPGPVQPSGPYSWATAPRWNGRALEAGAPARLWTTALASLTPHRRFIEPTGSSLKLSMPRGALPAEVLEWHVPQSWGALERTRARGYALALAALVAFEHALIALDLKRSGEDEISSPLRLGRQASQGAGFWGSSRGYLSHHLAVENGVIQNYQILTGSTWNLSPRDAFGEAGPIERATVGTPVSHGSRGAIDVLRTIRSFDPCLPCATH
jgi:hydrogenase large subunit